jgi:hypothetical protein
MGNELTGLYVWGNFKGFSLRCRKKKNYPISIFSSLFASEVINSRITFAKSAYTFIWQQETNYRTAE